MSQDGDSTLRPLDFLGLGTQPARHNVAMIIVNQEIPTRALLALLWPQASYHICADGGANRLYDILFEKTKYLPDRIHGDLDSLREHVREFYASNNVTISQDKDQYSTDFVKACRQIDTDRPRTTDFLVLGGIGGRLDHGIGLLSELFRQQNARPGSRFWLFSESSITFLLEPGRSIIACPLGSDLITPNVGILPVFGPASISTTGLEWDVTDWPTRMGGQISTSNHIVADQVCVTTDHTVLFTIETKYDVLYMHMPLKQQKQIDARATHTHSTAT